MRFITFFSSLILMTLRVAEGNGNEPTTGPSDMIKPKHSYEIWMGKPGMWDLGKDPNWEFVRNNLDGILLFVDDTSQASPEQKKAMAQVCNESGLKVIVELGGLLDWRVTPPDQSGELSFQDEYKKVFEFIQPPEKGGAGGRIDAINMDGPFRRMLYPNGDEPRVHTVDTAAREMVDCMRLWKEKIPDLDIYLLTNFPNWGWKGAPAYHNFGYEAGILGWGDYAEVLQTAIKATKAAGLPLAGVTADNPYDYFMGEQNSNQPDVTKNENFIERVVDLEKTVHQQGLKFTLIFNSERAGMAETGDDRLYFEETLAYIEKYHQAGGRPDNYLIESWYHYPSKLVAESGDYTLTHLAAEAIRKIRTLRVE